MLLQDKVGETELKLFLLFLLIFTTFIHWGGTNAWSRYDLTTSLVEDHSVDISENSYNTFDKRISVQEVRRNLNVTEYKAAGFENRTKLREEALKKAFQNSSVPVYTDKAPMSSFLAVPPYIIAEVILDDTTEEDEWYSIGVESVPLELSFGTSLKQALIVFSVSVVSAAILMVLIFSYIEKYTERNIALYTTLAVGLATPLSYYATSLFGVINASLFAFAAFLALERAESRTSRWSAIAGVLTALAFSTEYYAGIIIPVFLTYLALERRKKDSVMFLSGIFVASMPLLIYHWITTGNPFLPVPIAAHLSGPGPVNTMCSVYTECTSPGFGGLVLQPFRILKSMARLMFFESRGIFFYAPILLLSIPGSYELYRKDRKLLILFPGVFLLLLFFQASILNWLAGVSFGPRYAIVGLPFLILPVALGMRKIMDKGKIWKIIVVLVFSISLFNSFLGFNSLPGIEIGSEEYEERFNSFSAVQPEFYDGLIDKFERYGPRSEVLMSLTNRYKGFEITYREPYGQKFIELGSWSNKAVLFSTNLVSTMVVISLILIFFSSESILIKRAGVLLLVLLAASSFSLSDSYVSGEFYRSEDSYAGTNGGLKAVFYLDEGEIPYMEAQAFSKNGSRQITPVVNGKRGKNYSLKGYKQLYFPYNIHEGRNVVRLDAGECEIPGIAGNSSDARCLSSIVKHLSVKNSSEIKHPLLLKGWYDSGELSEVGAWMSEKGKVAFNSEEEGYRVLEMNITQPNYLENSSLSINFNGKDIRTLESHKDRMIYVIVKKEKGWNNLTMRSECVRPSEFTTSSDDRCLSLHINSLEFMAPNDIEEPIFSGFYEKDLKERPWLEKEGRIIFTPQERKIPVLELSRTSLLEEKGLSVSVNDRQIRVVEPGDLDQEIRLGNASIEQGLNQITLESDSCIVPAQELPNSSDNRCLSYRLENFSFSSFKLGFGWYDEEKIGDNEFRWMSKKSKLMFSGDGEKTNISINAEPYSYLLDPELDVIVNGEKVQIVKPDSSDKLVKNITVKTEEGINMLELRSASGCEVPEEKEENSRDNRCLSFKLESLDIEGTKVWS